MKQKELEYFFQESGQRRALAAYAENVAGPAWSLTHKMDLYDDCRCAYGTDAKGVENRREAFQRIYDALSSSSWGAFRPHGAAQCWPAGKIYDKIGRVMGAFAPSTGADLLHFEHRQRDAVISAMQKLRDMKPNDNYPIMAVSKFLHFFNPGLFPIWDNAVIDKRVFSRFDADYRDFCSSAGLSYDACAAEFLGNYLCWASTLLQTAAPQFMSLFVNWLRDEIPPRRFRALKVDDLLKLQATAFEFTIIGAAFAVD